MDRFAAVVQVLPRDIADHDGHAAVMQAMLRMPRPVVALLAAGSLLMAGCTGSGDADGPSVPDPGGNARASAPPISGEPPWWSDDVFYEVFVRSFADSDGDGTGDLRGLIDRLDHLNDGDPATTDDLGVTGLWLMPVTQSPSYHGYDTTDYYTVEQDYGTNADFRELVAAAHARGIRVIVDLVLNHTSVEHPWFVDSASGTASAKRDWYVWRLRDPRETTPWGSSAWHPRNGTYYLGLFWEGMPDLNHRNPAVREQVYDVARYWLEDMGADGFRLDAVRHLVEDGAQFSGTPETHAWLVAWDDHVDSIDPEALTVGEVWDATSVVAPYVTDDEVDLAFEFALAEAIITSVRSGHPGAFQRALAGVLAAYPPGQFAPFLANHDQERVMSRLGGDVAAAKVAATLLLTLPGTPFLYYGEEIGMTGKKPDERIRTPMQWTAGDTGGFTSGTPWQGLNDDVDDVNVAAQAGDPASLLNHYRRLVQLRAAHPSMRTGGLQTLDSTCPSVHAHLRTGGTGGADEPGDLLVVVNLSPDAQQGCALSVAGSDLPPGRYAATDLLTGSSMAEVTVADGGAVSGFVAAQELPARQSLVLRLQPAA